MRGVVDNIRSMFHILIHKANKTGIRTINCNGFRAQAFLFLMALAHLYLKVSYFDPFSLTVMDLFSKAFCTVLF